MGLLRFLFHRKKEQSVLAARKYSEKQDEIEERDVCLLARKKYATLEEKEKSIELKEYSILERKEYPKIFTEAEEKEEKEKEV